jgi:putative PIG3 family NAD(P)H quinone oxidoreductase
MRVVLLKKSGGPENLYLGERTIPAYGRDQLLIKVHACGLNRADCLQRQGFYPPPAGESELLGLEISGEIVGVGEAVIGFYKGQRVCGLVSGGGYADYCVLSPACAFLLPDSMDYVTAAGIPETFLTAYGCLGQLAKCQKGEHILIHAGASGVGTTALQLARAYGAHVFATVGSASKVDFLADLGFRAVNYHDDDCWSQLGLLNGQYGFDVILDVIGAEFLAQHLAILRYQGRLCHLSLLGGYQTKIDLRPILKKRLQLLGFTLRSQSLEAKGRLISQFKDDWWSDCCDGHLAPVIDRVFVLEDVIAAHEYLEGRRNRGKCILVLEHGS